MLRRLAATTDPTAQILMLRILGSAGDPRSLPAIRSLLASPSDDVRRTAVQVAWHRRCDESVRTEATRALGP